MGVNSPCKLAAARGCLKDDKKQEIGEGSCPRGDLSWEGIA